MKNTCECVVAGHICLDIIPDISKMSCQSAQTFFQPGALIDTGSAVLSTGGAVSNTGISLKVLGADVALMGKIGDDPMGSIVQQIVKDTYNVETGLIIDPAVTTSYTIVLAPENIDRMFLHCPGANHSYSADDIDLSLIKTAKIFHFGYPPLMRKMYENNGTELTRLYQSVKNTGVITSLDMAVPDPNSPAGAAPWNIILENTLPYVDIFTPSVDELMYMLNRNRWKELQQTGDFIEKVTGDDVHALGEQLLEMGVACACITCGHRGVYMRTAGKNRFEKLFSENDTIMTDWHDKEIWHPVFAIDVTPSATGSGDATKAGLLFGCLRGFTLIDSLRSATATGACNVTRPDALSGIIPWHKLKEKLDKGWHTVPLSVSGKGWKEDNNTWYGPTHTT